VDANGLDGDRAVSGRSRHCFDLPPWSPEGRSAAYTHSVATITAVNPTPARGGRSVAQPVTAPSSRVRAAWRAHRDALGNAAAVRDTFLDVIVLLSVIMFLALAVGVGVLVLGPDVQWPATLWPR
jgi:hypothetical protein